MNEKELDLHTLNDGFKELDSQLSRLKQWTDEEKWSEAWVRIGIIIQLLQGMRKTVSRLEGAKKQ